MNFKVTVAPAGHQFEVAAGERLLDAALRQGLNLPHGCRDGACGACKGQVLSGRVDHGRTTEQGLSTAERDKGAALFCCATALSDLTLESREARRMGEIAPRTFPVRVQSMQLAAPDVMILKLRLPANERLDFLAGQYVDILLKEGRRRSFSLANPPGQQDALELHVRAVAGGEFTSHVFAGLKEKDILRINGPYGSFYLREAGEAGEAGNTVGAAPLLLVAGGTGFAPIKSLLEEALARGVTRPMTLYWGGKSLVDLYQHEVAEAWAARYPHFRFVPVLAEPARTPGWRGRSGLVHQAVMADYPDLSGHQVYICGAPGMIAAARADFQRQCALPESAFFADAFDFAADARAAGSA